MALALHEDEDSYKFSYQTLKLSLKKYYNFELKPAFVMSDSHKGQLNAIQAIFPTATRLRCLFHLLQNIERKARASKLSSKTGYIKWVTYTLQEALTQQEFTTTWNLLKPELLKVTNEDFVKSYEKDYINSKAIWFRGGSFIGKQKTNNSLEAINRYLKEHWTQRISRTVPEFFTIMKKCFSHYNDKCKEDACFPMETKFLRKYFQKAEQILQKNLIFHVSAQIYAFIRLPKKFKKNQEKRAEGLKFRLEKIEERVEFIKQKLHNKFEKLATFTKVQCLFRYYDVDSGKCTCKNFYNRSTCKHSLATLLFLQKIKNPYSLKVNEGPSVGMVGQEMPKNENNFV